MQIWWTCTLLITEIKVYALKSGASDGEDDLGHRDFVQYDFATLKAATNDFSSFNHLGEGGFGVVYRVN